MEAVRVDFDVNYDERTGKARVYLHSRNHLPTTATVRTEVFLEAIKNGNPLLPDMVPPDCKKAAKKSRKDILKRGQRFNNEEMTLKIEPTSTDRFRVVVTVDPTPLVGENPFSMVGGQIINFTQGTNS